MTLIPSLLFENEWKESINVEMNLSGGTHTNVTPSDALSGVTDGEKEKWGTQRARNVA